MTLLIDESPPLLPIDLGAPVDPVRKPSWKGIRLIAIAKQKGVCAAPGCGKAPVKNGKPFLDVVERDDGTGVAFCASCRLRRDAPTRIPAAVRTRRENRGNPAIQVARSKHDTSPARSPDALLITEALTSAHVEGRPTPPAEACRALLRVLREHGMLAPALPAPARRRRRRMASAAVQDGAEAAQIQLEAPHS